MPSLGADMDAGTVVEWLIKPGDTVHKGDIVAVVDTAKAAVEVECFESGVIERLLVPEGQSVPVGTPLAVINSALTEASPHAGPEPTGTVSEPAEIPVPMPPTPPAPKPPGRPVPISPIIRQIAAHAGVDLSTVHGTGRGGAITRRDIERVAQTPAAPTRRPVSPYARTLAAELGVDLDSLTAKEGGPVTAAEVRAAAKRTEPQPPLVRRTPATDMRTAIAELMTKANQEIPHYHLAATIDLHTALTWLHDHNQTVPVTERLLPAALLLKATALAAAEVPELNGHWVDGGFRSSSTVDLGVAVSLRGGGLLVPVIASAETMPLAELMAALRERASRARSGRPRASDLAPASITVTNLGDLGVDLVHGVIHPPQVALVGFGAVADRPWAVDGLLGIRPVVTVTVAADHRATDGAVGARLLHAIDRILQHPEELT